MLKDVTARLGALEKESSIISQEMLADIGKKISSVQRDIKGYREETDRLICELKNKIDEVNCKPQQDNLQEEDESSHKGSLLRRDPWGIEIQKRPNQK
jgi:hypothetical protein